MTIREFLDARLRTQLGAYDPLAGSRILVERTRMVAGGAAAPTRTRRPRSLNQRRKAA